MNREIKFRAWDKEINQYRSPGTIQISSDGKPFVLSPLDNGSGFLFERLKNIIIEQFTGLTDKNGKEIYEGDIVSFGSSKTTYRVFWEYDGWMCISNDGDDWGAYTHRLFINTGDFKKNGQPAVLGNTHENPELLKP